MTKIFSKETTATSRCYVPPILILLCFFIFWSSLGQTQPNTTPILSLGPLYDCSQPLQLGILSYSSLKNFSHSMLQQEAHISPFRREVLQYSPIAITLPIHYPTLKTITMSCTYDKIFAGKQRQGKVQSFLVPDRLCLSAGLKQIIPLDHSNITLTKVSDTHWKTPAMSTFNCNYGHIFTKKYYNIHVKTYDAQLIGAANIIKQHLTKTPCSAAIDTTLHMGSCV